MTHKLKNISSPHNEQHDEQWLQDTWHGNMYEHRYLALMFTRLSRRVKSLFSRSK